MPTPRVVPMIALSLALCITPLTAQLEQEIAHDLALTAAAPSDVATLARELSDARRSHDLSRVREIERLLFRSMPGIPGDALPVPVATDGMMNSSCAPTWGNDVKVYAGDMYSYGKRQVVLDADTLGGIYLGLNARYQDSLSILRIYKSTNGGRAWTGVLSVVTPGRAIQAFDMCITDTTGGKFIIGVALVSKSDKTANGGGTLYWVSMLNDGTHFRSTIIGPASSSIGFRNPSICTDGAYYGNAYFFVAAEYIAPASDSSRGLWLSRSIDWGKAWSVPDTSIRGYMESTPVIAVNWGTSPDSMCIAFTRFAAPNREIRVARGGKTLAGGWSLTYPTSSKDEYDPALAIDPVRKNGIITYTRSSGAPTYLDAMYLRSTDLFKTFVRDSIATTAANEEYTSVAFAPWNTGYYFRTAYRSSAGSDTIYYKGIYNKITGFHGETAQRVSQYRPSSLIMPVVGFDRDPGGTLYRGNVAYVGWGPLDVYFDAVDLALDVPDGAGNPGVFALDQNYPNPFNPTTVIRFSVPHAGPVTLEVFTSLGQRVAVLTNGVVDAGTHAVRLDASALSSGVYFYRLTGDGFVSTRKCMLLR